MQVYQPNHSKMNSATCAGITIIILSIPSLPSVIFGLVFGILIVVGCHGSYDGWLKWKQCINIMFVITMITLVFSFVVVLIYLIMLAAAIAGDHSSDGDNNEMGIGAAIVLIVVTIAIYVFMIWLYCKARNSYNEAYIDSGMPLIITNSPPPNYYERPYG